MESLLLTPEQAAEALNVSRSAIFKLLASGELDSLKIGRARRIRSGALQEFVERLSSERDSAPNETVT